MIRNKDFLVLLIRLFLGYIFFSSGICKLTHGHFGQIIGPPWLEERLAKFDLGLFAQVVAYCQVIGGALLFSQRFSTLGAILLVPMNISILAVTISQKWVGTPYVNGVFLLLNLLALVYEHKKFRFLIEPRNEYLIKSVPLDRFRDGYFSWGILICALLTLLAAPLNNTTTNIFGALTFLAVGLTVCVPAILNNLEKIIVALAVINMLIITMVTRLTVAPKLIMGVSAVVFLLLLVNLFKRYRTYRMAPVLPG